MDEVAEVQSSDKQDAVDKETSKDETAKPREDKHDNSTKERGVALIKPQYIVHEHKMTLSKYLPQHITKQITLKHEQPEPNKQQKESKEVQEGEPPLKKLKGRFKKRAREKRLLYENKVCPAIVRDEPCRYAEKCRFTHDVKQFLGDNPPQEGDCYVYSTFGKCNFGVTCVHSRQHTDEQFKNIINQELVQKHASLPPRVSNVIPRDVARLLSRRQYDFQLSDKAVKLVKQGEKPTGREYVAKRSMYMNQNIYENDVQEKSNRLTPDSSNVAETSDDISNTHNMETDAAAHGSDVSDSPKNLVQITNCDIKSKEINSSILQNELGDNCANSNTIQNTKSTGNNTHEPSPISCASENENMKLAGGSCESRLDAEGIKLRTQECHKFQIEFRDKLYLAPLTTVGNLPFRRICKEFGADITCSEMATCTGLLQGSMSEWALVKRHHTEDIFGAQICGAYPDTMTRCAQVLMEYTDVDFIDVNMGCPIDLFYKKGEGCALMNKASKLETILSSMRAVMDAPLTVKMRTGIFEDKSIAHKLIQRVKDVGVSLVTIHGRSREQRYTRLADWQYINQCANMANQLPVYGNGDILSCDDYRRRREETNVSGCMIARGALIKPWVFTEIKESRDWDISANERFDMLKRFTNYGLEHWGSDAQGVANTRKFLLEWLSFLHRYIPVGLLERPPQRINEKPPRFCGRNDLETLMASKSCGDWVKISEMLLGPVPDGFEFIPKHKANAYS